MAMGGGGLRTESSGYSCFGKALGGAAQQQLEMGRDQADRRCDRDVGT
jgi:hypothetical protein